MGAAHPRPAAAVLTPGETPGEVTPAGLVLAAGAGRRMGQPKATVVDRSGRPLLQRAVEVLAGCRPVVAVLGAGSDEALTHLPVGVEVVVAERWADGMSASLRAGLVALQDGDAAAVLVTLVDLPDVGPDVGARLRETWRAAGGRPDALLRAAYGGVPGHPVLIGRRHWEPLLDVLAGDEGAGPYLRRHMVQQVSCDDLATGADADRPEDLGGLG